MPSASTHSWQNAAAEALERVGIVVLWDGLDAPEELRFRLRGCEERLGTIKETEAGQLLVRLDVAVAHPQHDFDGAWNRLKIHFNSLVQEGAEVNERVPMDFFVPWEGFCLDHTFDEATSAARWIREAVTHGLILDDPEFQYEGLVEMLDRLHDQFMNMVDTIDGGCSFALQRSQWHERGEVPQFEGCDAPGAWVAIGVDGEVLDAGVTEDKLLDALRDQFDAKARQFRFARDAVSLWTWRFSEPETFWMARWIAAHVRRILAPRC